MLHIICLFIGILILSWHTSHALEPLEDPSIPLTTSRPLLSQPLLEGNEKKAAENIINSHKIVLLSYPREEGFEKGHKHLKNFYEKYKLDTKYNLYEKYYQERFPLTNDNSVLLVEDVKEKFIRALLGGFTKEEGAEKFRHLLQQQGYPSYTFQILSPKFIAPDTTTYGNKELHFWPT